MKPIPFNKTILEIIPNEYYIIYLSMGMEILTLLRMCRKILFKPLRTAQSAQFSDFIIKYFIIPPKS